MMDVRPDTSTAQFGGQWAFLSSPLHGHTRSLPPSSYQLGHDVNEPSLSQRTAALFQFNASRSSVWRYRPATSTGSHISTLPSQPVTVRVHSADASSHLNPSPRRDFSMSNRDELPPVSEFSIDGILSAIQPDIDGTIDAIAEIMGRSRLTLANEYESHLPPQGEIRASNRPGLLPVEEASSSNERLAADNILIADDEASLVDGSRTGSAAYGLLERLRASPRSRRQRSDAPTSWAAGPSRPLPRTISSPAELMGEIPPGALIQSDRPMRSPKSPRFLLGSPANNPRNGPRSPRMTNAVVSETYLLAGANGRPATNPPVVSEAGRHYPLYSYDESDLFEAIPEPTSPSRLQSFQSRMQNLMLVNDLQGLAAWLHQERPIHVEGQRDAERRLRAILDHHGVPSAIGAEAQNDLHN